MRLIDKHRKTHLCFLLMDLKFQRPEFDNCGRAQGAAGVWGHANNPKPFATPAAPMKAMNAINKGTKLVA